ncbi:hypothetical protein HN295_20005 [Acinetobacter baumannii]|nr:hypothetical protein [Acinetobacter baumannii]
MRVTPKENSRNDLVFLFRAGGFARKRVNAFETIDIIEVRINECGGLFPMAESGYRIMRDATCGRFGEMK